MLPELKYIKRAAKYLSRRLAALLHWYMPIRFKSDNVNTCFCKVGAFVKMHFAQKAIYTRGLYAKSQLGKVPLLKCELVQDAQESNNERMELDTTLRWAF